jgi:hypothetical protein
LILFKPNRFIFECTCCAESKKFVFHSVVVIAVAALQASATNHCIAVGAILTTQRPLGKRQGRGWRGEVIA